MKFELKERLIVYFDVLGYKYAFSESNFNALVYLEKIKAILSETKRMFSGDNPFPDIMIKMFSDNVCLIFDGEKGSQALYVKVILSELQKQFLCEYDMLIRGAIVRGYIYADDEIVFGQGLIDCVDLEGKANFPRIILQDGLEDEFMEDGYICVEKGFDGKYEILYLKQDADDIDDKDIKDLQRSILRVVSDNCACEEDDSKEVLQKKEKLIDKYVWLIESFNFYNSGYGYGISYRIDINFENSCKRLFLLGGGFSRRM